MVYSPNAKYDCLVVYYIYRGHYLTAYNLSMCDIFVETILSNKLLKIVSLF